MISILNTTKMTDHSVIAACPLGVSMRGTDLSATSSLLPVLPVRERSERPIQASAVAAAAAQVKTYAFAAAANGAGAGTAKGASAANGHGYGQQKKTQLGSKWPFRGLEPWSDPT